MGQARHPLSLLLVLATAVAAFAAGGCGSSDESSKGRATTGEGATTSTAPAGAAARNCSATVDGVADLSVTGVDCEEGRGVVVFWTAQRSCRRPAGASRVSCSVAAYRCLGATTDRGLAVSCARPGRSVSFVAKRG